jgi:mono/diheme cytochrome c family protein
LTMRPIFPRRRAAAQGPGLCSMSQIAYLVLARLSRGYASLLVRRFDCVAAGRLRPAKLLCSLAFALMSVQMLAAPSVLAAGAQLGFSVAGKPIASFDLDELGARLKARDLSLFDPEYGKPKHYRAFPLGEVLRLGFGSDWASDVQADIAFQALDGYRAITPVAKVAADGGFLVFRDLDLGGWEPVGRMQASPGPYYVVWTGAEQTTRQGYPWPWQLAMIELVRFDESYPEVRPKGADPDSQAVRGFDLFKQRCVRCHSINGQGGAIGPDLNAPMGILTYRSAQMVKEFIRHPSLYRYTRMPDHTDLSDNDLDALIAYFWHKGQESRSK